MFSEDQGFFGLWLMSSEDQRFRISAHVFKGLGFLDLGSCFQRTKGFLGFGSCQCVWAFYLNTCKINIFN